MLSWFNPELLCVVSRLHPACSILMAFGPVSANHVGICKDGQSSKKGAQGGAAAS